MNEYTEKQIQVAREWAAAAEALDNTCREITQEIEVLKKRYHTALGSYRRAKGWASVVLPDKGYLEIEVDERILKIERYLDDYDIINLPLGRYPF
jgi:hypothetical protein